MEYELTDTGPCRKKMLLKFTEDDIGSAFEESYREINNYVQVKGFRKGKAPRQTLEKRFKTEAAAGAKRFLTEKNLGDAIKKENLKLIGGVADKHPSEVPTPGHPFTLEVEMDVAPEFDLPEYTGLELTEQPVEVKEEDVEQVLERYRKIFANYEPVYVPAELGSVVVVDFSAAVDGEEILSMKDQRLRVEGEKLFDLPCPELIEKFQGSKAGDTVTIGITMPLDHPNPELRGKPAQVTALVKLVERGELPELNDVFAGNLGMNSIAEFRDRIKANLYREALLEARTRQEEELVDKLLSAVSFETPPDLVNSETDALVAQRRMTLERTEIEEDALKAQLEAYHPEAAKQALRRVRWNIMSEKIAEKENISVSREDLEAQVEALARSYQTTPAKVIQRIREFDGTGAMITEILSIKVFQFLIDHAKGGRLHPDRKDTDTDSLNAMTAESFTDNPNADRGDPAPVVDAELVEQTEAPAPAIEAEFVGQTDEGIE
ncbi:MAG: trigger factor [Planctomycetes bacterium]|nr:trigger factor [Planctomycetota bacterium]